MRVKLLAGAKMPTRAHELDAGLDLYSRDADVEIAGNGGSAIFDTGVCVELERGTFGKIESKSGLNVKYGVVSCGGVIDAGYTGSIAVKLYNFGSEAYTVKRGDKVAQMVILPCLTPELEEVADLTATERGAAGFGSTGR